VIPQPSGSAQPRQGPQSLLDPLPIRPLAEPPDAVVELPGSKSITNRALVTAALAEGVTDLRGVLFADDTWAMIEGLRTMGTDIDIHAESARATVQGCAGPPSAISALSEMVYRELAVDARQSGTTARFLAAVAAMGTSPVVVDGDPQLRARPMADLIEALRSMGVSGAHLGKSSVSVDELGEPGCLPLRVTGISGLADCDLPGEQGQRVLSASVPGSVSSQFASGLLMAGAVCDLTLRIAGGKAPGSRDREPTALVSAPYVEMTLGVMRAFGAQVTALGDDSQGCEAPGRVTGWHVAGGYTSPGVYHIEPDASAASYLLAAAAVSGGRVRIDGLGRSSMQGDVAFADVLARMGANVDVGENHIEVRHGSRLHGIDVDLSQISDTAPTLAVAAAFAEGPTTVTGIGFIRGKESDRVAGPVAELRRCGVDAVEHADGFSVHPAGPPRPALFETYGDHRMAMAFAMVGLMVDGVSIADPGCVAKTFPGYFDALDQLR